MTSAPFLSRHLGDYLLVAQLSEDALGTVFRALYAADERRFVRLRILRSEGLSPEAIERLIAERVAPLESPRHESIVDRPQLDQVEGIPFMTWDEASGWTLDTLLARVRAFGIRIPAEYALLIAERIASGLEHVQGSDPDAGPVTHGLLWPGFVCLSHDASVRMGGFGLAEAVIPSLQSARLKAEIAPYLAPEVRDGGPIGPNADVYSLGAILAELLTGRRPSPDSSEVEMRAGDPRSEELQAFLQQCMAPEKERFASAADAHRALQLMVTGNPFSLYTANLALFIYKLLNPESQAPSSDWESTNPVVMSTMPSRAGAALAAAAPLSPIVAEPLPIQQEIAMAPPEPEPLPVLVEAAATLEEPSPTAATVPMPAADLPATPVLARAHALVLLERKFSGARALAATWSRPAAALAAAAGLSVGAFLVASQFRPAPAPAPRVVTAARDSASLPVPSESPAASPEAAPAISPVSAAQVAVVMSGPAGSFQHAAAHPAGSARKPVPLASRQPAEDLRLRAALARIEADRLNAKESAGDLFGEGRHSEEEGERLLRQRDYDAAQLAFSRAATLFQKAGELSFEERLRQQNLSATR